MLQSDVDKLLAGRTIINAYRIKGGQGIDESPLLADKLRALGFVSSNPIQEFFEFNDAMGVQALKETPILGVCDFCAGFVGTPYCQNKFGNGSCAVTKKSISGDDVYKAVLFRLQQYEFQGQTFTKADNWNTLMNNLKKSKLSKFYFCPTGHGYYIEPSTMTLSPFDLRWR
jgi:hypothetical protein